MAHYTEKSERAARRAAEALARELVPEHEWTDRRDEEWKARPDGILGDICGEAVLYHQDVHRATAAEILRLAERVRELKEWIENAPHKPDCASRRGPIVMHPAWDADDCDCGLNVLRWRNRP